MEAFTRPSLLIMDCATLSSASVWNASAGSRKQREQRLKTALLSTLRAGGLCLLPCDSSARVLELLLFLHFEVMSDPSLPSGPGSPALLFASPQSDVTVEFAASSIEWLSDACQKYLNQHGVNPFSIPELRCVRSFDAVHDATRGFSAPAIVLATSASLDPPTISHRVLEAIAQQCHSAVFLTHDVEDGSVAHQLLEQRLQQPQGAAHSHAPLSATFLRPVHVPLEGDELRAFLAQQRLKDEQRLMENQTTAMEEEEDDEDEDDDDDDRIRERERHGQGASLPLPLAPSAAAVFAAAPTFPSFYAFPFTEPRRSSDAFGEVGLEGFIDAGAPGEAEAAERGAAAHPMDAQQQPPSERRPVLKQPTATAVLVPSSSSSFPAGRSASVSSSSGSGGSSAAKAASTGAGGGAPVAAPTRVTFVASSMAVQCRVVAEDFRGLSDGRSWKNILTAVKPRKLVLVHGDDAEKQQLRAFVLDKKITQQPLANAAAAAAGGAAAGGQQQQHAAASEEREAAMGEGSDVGAMDDGPPPTAALFAASRVERRARQSVFVPSTRECVDISAEVSFRLALSSALLPRLRFARVNDFEVAFVEAAVQRDPLQPIDTPQLVPLRDVASAAAAHRSSSMRPSVFLGSYKLSDFRALLHAAGIDSEFQGGAVLVAARGTVRIRKASPTRITMQGIVSDAYFTIRKMLYAQYQKV